MAAVHTNGPQSILSVLIVISSVDFTVMASQEITDIERFTLAFHSSDHSSLVYSGERTGIGVAKVVDGDRQGVARDTSIIVGFFGLNPQE